MAGATRLVLLPGMDGTGELFGPLLRALPPRIAATVVAYPHDRRLGYAELQPIVEAAVPASRRYVLVAESFSGPLAIRHAAARPRGLQALVLCATFARNPLPRSLRWLRAFARAPFLRLRPTRELVCTFLTGRDCPSELLDAVIAASGRARPAVFAHRLREVFDVDVTESVHSIGVPVLYLAGSADRLVGRRGLAQFTDRVPALSSVVLDGPHLLLQTRPREAVCEITRFLGSR